MDWTAEREEAERFRALITRRMGLHFDEGKRDFLSGVLRQRLQETGQHQPAQYFTLLASESGSKEWRLLAEHLTVAETYFFRNKDQFRALEEAVLPELRGARAECRRLRILSAGCATGEEPYSIAMLLRHRFPDLAHWDIKIFGMDVNPCVVDKAVRGRYSVWSLRETDDEFKNRYFGAEGREFVLDASIRAMVSFGEGNLAEDDSSRWPMGPYDIVFCRNVTMYFTPEAARAAIAKIRGSLAPGGYLFLGHAETLRGISNEFHLCHTHETFYYRLREDHPPDRKTSQDIWTGKDATVPVPLGSDVSWVDAIQRASERIESLAQKTGNDLRPLPASARNEAAEGGSRANLSGAMELLVQERFAEALDSLHALPPEARKDADAELLHAVLLTNAGQLDKSEVLCGELLQRDEMNAGAHYLMALCREHHGDRTAASEHDYAAAYLDPGFAMPHFHLGLMAKRAGDFEAARRELAAALAMFQREDASRILLFGGGFSRETLVSLCRSELNAAGGSA